MRTSLIYVLVCFSVAHGAMRLKVTKHFPCGQTAGPLKQNEVLRLSGYRDPDVTIFQLPNTNCMAVRGLKMFVGEPGLINGTDYQALLEMKFGLQERRESCIHADADGCGGVGSCVQCSACSIKDNAFVQFFHGHKPLDTCAATPGLYQDIGLKMCFPSKDEILSLIDTNRARADKLWNSLLQTNYGLDKAPGLPVVLVIRIYDMAINRIADKDDLMYGSKRGMIGCHYIRAIVSEDETL